MDKIYDQAITQAHTTLRSRLLVGVLGLALLITGMVMVTRVKPRSVVVKATPAGESSSSDEQSGYPSGMDNKEGKEGENDTKDETTKTVKGKWSGRRIALTVVIAILILLVLWLLFRTMKGMYAARHAKFAAPSMTTSISM